MSEAQDALGLMYDLADSSFVPSRKDPVHWLSKDLKARFGGPVRKAGLDAGGACPNRDGTLGQGGCAWCDPGGSGPDDPVSGEAWEDRLERLARRAAGSGYAGVVAYFQAFTATYALRPLELEARARRALAVPGVVGLAFATRPDCLDPEQAVVLGRLAHETLLWVELGMQTAHDETLAAMNRGHGHAETARAARDLRSAGVRTVLHLILGLPGEDAPAVRTSLAEAARLQPWGVKIHPLHVVKGSALARRWKDGRLALPDLQWYAALAADAIEMIAPSVTVHRLTGERPPSMLLAPEWCRDKRRTLGAILSELARRKSWQGRRWMPPPLASAMEKPA